jgi:threonine/homoserine/homoserine lactone efflux protein
LTWLENAPDHDGVEGSLAAFLAISIVVIVSPGQDTALTIRNTLTGGRPGGVATAVGVAAGQFVWTIAASAGITALLVASEPVFTAVRLAGAAYLVYLGTTTLWSAWRRTGIGDIRETRQHGPATTGRAFRQGLLSNLGNPKMVVFFSSLLPQFAPADGPVLLSMLSLGLLFCGMTLSWLTAYAWLIAQLGPLFRRPAVRRVLDLVMGTILVALGLRLAAEPVAIER